MSSGVFNVIKNTSQNERLLYAQSYLKERINKIIKNKLPNITDEMLLSLPENDKYLNMDKSILPSLTELEQSHNLFINSSYKPSVPLTSEYIKVSHSQPEFGNIVTYQMPSIGHFTNDCVLHIRLSGMSAKDYRDRVRYVSMIGHKLVENVQFVINNGSIIDEYSTDDYNAYYQYEVKPEHKIGYLRNIGQEIPEVGYMTSDPLVDMFREYKYIGDGNQTLKHAHEPIDLFIPLLFWFRNIRTSLPALSWGQLQFKVKLANISDIIAFFDGGGGGKYNAPKIEFCDLYVNQLFTLPEIFNLYAKKFVFSIIRVHKSHKKVIKTHGEKEYEMLLNNLKYPTEVLYFSFRPRDNLALSQYWHKNCKLTKKSHQTPVAAKDPNNVLIVTAVADATRVSTENKITIASEYVLSTTDNAYASYDFVIIAGTGYNLLDITKNRYTVKSYTAIDKIITINETYEGFLPDETTVFELYTPRLAMNLITYYKEEPVVDTISLIANGIELFKSTKSEFYNSYIPSKYAGVNTPDDRGLYMMPFCNKMLQHNPSGTIDVSLCREFYLRFTSNKINSQFPVDLIVLAKVINFLLIDNNTLSLKYNA